MIDLTGKQIGHWTVVERVKGHPKGGWLCRCACGNEKTVRTERLTSGISKSCGCKRYEIRDGDKRLTYANYLAVKQAVIEEDATVNYVKEKLNISLILARCLVKDWKNESE